MTRDDAINRINSRNCTGNPNHSKEVKERRDDYCRHNKVPSYDDGTKARLRDALFGNR